MNYDLAKLMQEALKKNKNIYKKAMNTDFHFSKSFLKDFKNLKDDEIKKVICKKMLFMLEDKLEMVKKTPIPHMHTFIKDQILGMLQVQNNLFFEQGEGHEYEEAKQYYPEFNGDDEYFKRYGELVNIVYGHISNLDSFVGETPFDEALELIVEDIQFSIE